MIADDIVYINVIDPIATYLNYMNRIAAMPLANTEEEARSHFVGRRAQKKEFTDRCVPLPPTCGKVIYLFCYLCGSPHQCLGWDHDVYERRSYCKHCQHAHNNGWRLLKEERVDVE